MIPQATSRSAASPTPPILNTPGGPTAQLRSAYTPVASPREHASPGSPRHQSGTIDVESMLRSHGGDLRRTLDSVVGERNALVRLSPPATLTSTASAKHPAVEADREAALAVRAPRGRQRSAPRGSRARKWSFDCRWPRADPRWQSARGRAPEPEHHDHRLDVGLGPPERLRQRRPLRVGHPVRLCVDNPRPRGR
jgi:hypothetical protein